MKLKFIIPLMWEKMITKKGENANKWNSLTVLMKLKFTIPLMCGKIISNRHKNANKWNSLPVDEIKVDHSIDVWKN